MSRREYLHRYVSTWDGLVVCCSSDFLIYCSFYIKKVLYSEVHGINITITGSYNELNDISLLPLAFASKKKGFVVSFRRKSLLCLILLLSGDIETCPSFLNMKGLSVFHQNIRGLHGEKEIFSDILYNNSKIDIFPVLFNAENPGVCFSIKNKIEWYLR